MADDTKPEKKEQQKQVADLHRPGYATDGSKLVWRKPVLKMLPMEEDIDAGKPFIQASESSTLAPRAGPAS